MSELQTNPLFKPRTLSLNKDIAAGGIFLFFAAIFGLVATNYPMGTLARIGPGYYPLMLSGLLALLAIAIIVKGWAKPPVMLVVVRPASLIFVLGAPLLFALTIRPLGFILAVILTTLMATMAAHGMAWRVRLACCLVMALGCSVIFIWALNVPLPLFGSFLFLRSFIS